jgi:DNA-directed RNA polymerase subunit M/transcription elongation factor TFIIS
VTFSFEISREHKSSWPPFTDGCPACEDWDGTVVPYATTTEGETLTAFYRHKRCGHQWSCRWQAQWDSEWAA